MWSVQFGILIILPKSIYFLWMLVPMNLLLWKVFRRVSPALSMIDGNKFSKISPDILLPALLINHFIIVFRCNRLLYFHITIVRQLEN